MASQGGATYGPAAGAPPPPTNLQHHLPPPPVSSVPVSNSSLYPPTHTEMLWKPRYHPPLHHMNYDYGPTSYHERERMLRERRDHEQNEKQLKEKERIDKLMIEREREDRERREEKDRQASKLVHKHFEESLRLASQKRERTASAWSTINSLSPAGGGARDHNERIAREQERMGRDHERLLRPYYPATTMNHQVQRPPSAPIKTEYSPQGHGRLSVPQKPLEKATPMHGGLPKAEPNFGAYGYPPYRPANSYDKVKIEPGKHPYPDRLLAETKNSVIVKHDTKPPQIHLEQKHSPYVSKQNLVRGQEYLSSRPYRSGGGGLSPLTSHATSLSTIPLTTSSLNATQLAAAPADKSRARLYQPSPAQPKATTGYYYAQPGGRPKVSSPAPSHMYGKPSASPGLSIAEMAAAPSSDPPPVPYPPPCTFLTSHQGRVPPPPAHHISEARDPPRAHGVEPSAPCQLQPLDLGVSVRQDDANSPRRRYPFEPAVEETNDFKKRRTESSPSPVASLRTEPTPQIAAAVTAAISARSVCGTDAAPQAPGPPCDLPVPSTEGSIGTPEKANVAPSPGPIPPSSPQAAAPAEPPVPSPPAPSAPVRHLGKKAWLQRHETAPLGDEERSGGGGVCLTLPMAVSPAPPVASPSPVKSLHRIGSMAVNSIGRTKTSKARKTPKESENRDEARAGDSSSSDREIDEKPKRKPPKSKRRKGTSSSNSSGTRKASDDNKKKKSSESGSGSGGSASGSDSDKESDGGESPKRPRRNAASGNGKRNGRQSERRKRRERPPANNTPANKQRKTSDSFLQNGSCCDVAPKLVKCRECRWSPNERDGSAAASIFCRFYHFRKLRYSKSGQLTIAGFSDPKDADSDDEKLWTSSLNSGDLDIEMSCFLLREIGDHFCRLLTYEKKAKELHRNDDSRVVWKRVVQGVRELCDVCLTTLFNYHWTCGKCGFVVCIDCYQARTSGEERSSNGTSTATSGSAESESERKDENGWLTCSSHNETHLPEQLLLTQIAARSALTDISERMHKARSEWGLKPCGACQSASANESSTAPQPHPVAMQLLADAFAHNIKKEKGTTTNGESTMEALSWFELPKSSNNSPDISNNDNNSSSSDEGSTLRDKLSAVPKSKSHTKKTQSISASAILAAIDTSHNKLSDGTPRYMVLAESKQLYPKTPHAWLCGGRLLHLTDPQHPANYKAFQDQWKRGQPVIVSDVSRLMNSSLWSPDSFIKDFGQKRVDLVNCTSGLVVPNQPASRFWKGFESVACRLRDERNATMVLKIKDWPPGEDFAEMLPTRFEDLMQALPLREYTTRNGSLNLAARLPECLVRPDLGPKMYTAYGGAGGTTNLHLDVSDAVNVLVWASFPRDAPERSRDARSAVELSVADEQQRRRARQSPAALWHIYPPQHADKIRDFLTKVEVERACRPSVDPVHDQTWYLDALLRERLYREYGVEGYTIIQCPGDAVFVPAGAPHQVRNLMDCIKVAEDFVSPENVAHCFHLAQQFRKLSASHSNREDKLQIKNIVYHAVKDSLCALETALKQQS